MRVGKASRICCNRRPCQSNTPTHKHKHKSKNKKKIKKKAKRLSGSEEMFNNKRV